MNRKQRVAAAGVAALAGLAVLVGVGANHAAAGNSHTAGNSHAAGPGKDRGSCARDQAAIRAVPQRIEQAWAQGDADAVAAVFTPDTDFVVGDGTFLRNRDEVRRYMAAGFDGFLDNSRVTAPVDSVRCLSRDVGVVHTLGGILLPGEQEVPPERQGVQVFVVTKHGGQWLADVYQNTRISPSG